MSELNVQKYLRQHGLQALIDNYAVKTKDYPDQGLLVLNYDQIESPKNDPITNECRGLILHRKSFDVVSRSFDRFFNYGECGTDQSIDFSKCHVVEKLDGCFLYSTRIKCWDGSTVKIGDIVKKGVRPPLIGMNDKGELVPSFIEEVKNNGCKKSWVKLKLESFHGCRPLELIVTPNHQVLLNGEYKAADQTIVGDKMVKVVSNLDTSGIHFVKASLLGDGSVVRNGQTGCKFEVGHTAKDCDYLYWKRSCFGDLASKIKYRTSGYGSEIGYFSSKTFHGLSKLRCEWYSSDGKKRLPDDISWIDDFAVAVWYMDDGSLSTNDRQKDRAVFSTNAFSYEDCLRLAEKLQQLYGVSCTVHDNKGWCIRVNSGKSNEIESFWKSIRQYVHPSMKRKLPYGHRDFTRIPVRNFTETWDTLCVTVTGVEYMGHTKKNFPHGSTGFDIQTSTKNYFANGLCVHNSLIKIYFHQGYWHCSTRGTAFAETCVNGFDVTFADLVYRSIGVTGTDEFNDWCQSCATLDRTMTYVCEITAMENRVVTKYVGTNLYLLAVRNNRTGECVAPSTHVKHWFSQPRQYYFDSVQHCLKAVKELPNLEEGYVLYNQDGQPVCKIKSPAYVAAHLLRGEGLNPKRIAQLVLMNEVDEYLSVYPEDEEHFEPIQERYHFLMMNVQDVWDDTRSINDRKEFALKVKDHPLSAVLFQAKNSGLMEPHLVDLFHKQTEVYQLRALGVK